MSDGRLQGVGVLVTRPQHQADELSAAIEHEGGEAIRFPVIEIEAEDSAYVTRCLESLPSPDITIFISSNAVIYGLPYLHGNQGAIVAIGPATKSAIESAGRQADVCPSAGYDSEHLLAEPALQDVSGKNIRIVRGDGGRELLANTLRERGASVDYLAVYRKQTRTYSPSLLSGLEHRWRDGQVHYVIAMSIDTLEKLIEILPASCRELLGKTPLVTPSTRVMQTASDRIPGATALLAEGPQTDNMVRALIACRQSQSG